MATGNVTWISFEAEAVASRREGNNTPIQSSSVYQEAANNLSVRSVAAKSSAGVRKATLAKRLIEARSSSRARSSSTEDDPDSEARSSSSSRKRRSKKSSSSSVTARAASTGVRRRQTMPSSETTDADSSNILLLEFILSLRADNRQLLATICHNRYGYDTSAFIEST